MKTMLKEQVCVNETHVHTKSRRGEICLKAPSEEKFQQIMDSILKITHRNILEVAQLSDG